MQYNFTYYVHHHGAGHITRAIAIAKELIVQCDCTITFLGTGLEPYREQIPAPIKILELPADLPTNSDTHHYAERLNHLHYSPLNISGLLYRNSVLVDHFKRNPKTICIVDVSCEITQLARLCGIPTVLIRQHGNRRDLAHQLAYDSAAFIIAPYAQEMSSAMEEGLYKNKILFSGGFSRFMHNSTQDEEDENCFALILGKGGSDLDEAFVYHLLKQLPLTCTLHILGELSLESSKNLVVHGHIQDPLPILKKCSVIICNAGHNTVMEMGSLRKRIVCVPASRPFDEQLVKAAHSARLNLAIVVPKEQRLLIDWIDTINQAKLLDTSLWSSIMNKSALAQISNKLQHVYQEFFTESSAIRKIEPKYA